MYIFHLQQTSMSSLVSEGYMAEAAAAYMYMYMYMYLCCLWIDDDSLL